MAPDFFVRESPQGYSDGPVFGNVAAPDTDARDRLSNKIVRHVSFAPADALGRRAPPL
jgi:hypothetical protein